MFLEGKCSEKIKPLWTDNKDVHYPTYELNPAHVESSGRGKLVSISSSQLEEDLAPKLCHLGRHMG